MKTSRAIHIALVAGLFVVLSSPAVVAQESVFLEELTSTEVRSAIRVGKTTIIIPTGGTEQNGPHMILGKHNIRVKYAAGEIAKLLGDALVAPVLAYTPEGEINPPTGHMRAAGTITLPASYFAKVVEYAARSFKAHGMQDVVLIGDSGPNQAPLQALARRLNKEWASTSVRVHHASAYYNAQTLSGTASAERNFIAWLKTQNVTAQEIGAHAGLADTSLLLAVYPEGVRKDKLAPGRRGDATGVIGDPTRASATFGTHGLNIAIDAAVQQIRQLREFSRK